ncbi:MAG: hypothetical protein CMB80_16385 [Flammeovirgaceae bacterium]|nr:hypothetical protein [Flammeovirgaceae bacterium]|tara:strand:- start:162 stop:572 length:411 start_codon:yes stop_codon:yes gene_type:complete
MASTGEKKVKQWLKRKLKKDFPDCWIYLAPGGKFGRIGVPDLILCVHGLFISIEAKAFPGLELTKNQKHESGLILKAGGLASSMKGKDEVKYNAIVSAIRSRIEVKLRISKDNKNNKSEGGSDSGDDREAVSADGS